MSVWLFLIFLHAAFLSEAVLLWEVVTVGRKNRPWGEGEEGKEEVGKQTREEMRSFLRRGAVARSARTPCWWPRADPGRHLVPQGELELTVTDYKIISITGREYPPSLRVTMTRAK